MLVQESRTLNEENKKIISWLSPLNFYATHQSFVERRQEGTGEWILNHALFDAWVKGRNKTLWCPGIRKTLIPAFLSDHADTIRAGAGKTIIA
jgi:hypothetical protein